MSNKFSTLNILGKFIILSVSPIRHAESGMGWADVLKSLITIIGYSSVPVINKVSSLTWFNWQNGTAWAWFLGIPAILFLIAGLRLSKKLSDLERKELELVYDNNGYRACYEKRIDVKTGNPVHHYRLGVINRNSKTIDGVTVSVLVDNAQPISDQPEELNPHNRNKTDFPPEFSVNPSQRNEPTAYVEFISTMEGENVKEEDQMGIHFYSNYHPESNEDRRQRGRGAFRNLDLRVTVQGRDIKSRTWVFHIKVGNNNKLDITRGEEI